MKLFEFIKEVWKQNKINFLIACGVVILGCLMLYASLGSPLEYSIPIGILIVFILMYLFSFIVRNKKDK